MRRQPQLSDWKRATRQSVPRFSMSKTKVNESENEDEGDGESLLTKSCLSCEGVGEVSVVGSDGLCAVNTTFVQAFTGLLDSSDWCDRAMSAQAFFFLPPSSNCRMLT